ncbi:MAG: exosome complex protein Rrp42 [Thermoproteota archaeon]
MSTTPQRSVISKILQDDIIKLANKGERIDGRAFDESRRIKITTGFVEKAEGSALVELGSTRVLVGVKIETGTPFPDTPDEGVLSVTAELVPLASETFEPGPPNENSIALARFVDRAIRESKALNLKELCIELGKKVYVVMIDIYVLDHSGNLVDASALAALAALVTTKFPVKIEEDQVTKTELRQLPIRELPIATTLAILDGKLILDPNLQEEQATGTYISFVSLEDGRICAVQKNGSATISLDMISEALKIASIKSRELRQLLFRKDETVEQV